MLRCMGDDIELIGEVERREIVVVAYAPPAERESWWTRWRKRGLLIGGSTVIAAMAGVGAWLGWSSFA